MTANWPVLSLNSKGADVTVLQYLLRCGRSEWATLAADGVFGPQTEATVKAFQRTAFITVDGVVGPATDAATRSFQKRTGLKVDGIVGPLTYEKLICIVED